ncbi:MAG: glucose 1-dehydrogenase [Litoreibacter sp.]
MTLKGKTAIVTGAGRDIGRACAIRLAQAGANVALNYHSSSEGAESAVAEIKEMGLNAFAMQGDLTQEADAEALVARTVADLGGLNVLVNNTGGLVARKTVAEMTLDHFHTVMNLNLATTFIMIKASLPHLKSGAIVNLASQAGRDGGGPGSSIYAASKGAVMTLTRSLAKELGPDIRVNGINPGMIDTDFHNIFTKPEVRTMVAGNTPLKREGVPMDIANLVAYLASDEAAFVTGTNVDINGGMLFS